MRIPTGLFKDFGKRTNLRRVGQLIRETRSIRRFDESHEIPDELLRKFADCARLSASATNAQPLKYIISSSPEKNAKIFQHLKWAGHIKDGAPKQGQRPSAYIIILHDKNICGEAWVNYDVGLASQSIRLAVTAAGLGSCPLGAIGENLRQALGLPEQYEIKLVIAIGKPAETVAIEPVKNGETKYWREGDTHHVPKRPLDEVILEL